MYEHMPMFRKSITWKPLLKKNSQPKSTAPRPWYSQAPPGGPAPPPPPPPAAASASTRRQTVLAQHLKKSRSVMAAYSTKKTRRLTMSAVRARPATKPPPTRHMW